jgi:hypothetical protein
VNVSGLRGGSAWRDSFPAAADVKGAGIDKLWARRKIQALTDSLEEGADPGEVRRAVANLGLRHHLVTDYTSLVAVDDQATAPAGVQPVQRVVPVNRPQPAAVDSGPVQEMITVAAETPLVDERRISTCSTVSQADLERIPTARHPWPPALPDDEAKALCEEIGRNGWTGLTLERVVRVAPFEADALRNADAVCLLRGLVAVLLHGKGCPEPPADVLAEAEEYICRFGNRPCGS